MSIHVPHLNLLIDYDLYMHDVHACVHVIYIHCMSLILKLIDR